MLKINQYIAQRLLLYVDELGHSPSQICDQLDVKYEEIIEQKTDFIEDQIEQLWIICCDVTGEEELGFLLGQSIGLESLGTFGMLLQHVNTIEECMEIMINFAPLVIYLFELKIDMTADRVRISIIPDAVFLGKYPARLKQACLLTISLMIKMYAILTMKKPGLMYVAMPAQVSNRRLTEFCYEDDIAIHPKHYVLDFSSKVLKLPIISANEHLTPYLLEAANHEMKSHYKEWTSKVYSYISLNANNKTPALHEVAQSIGLSTRSLQRRLQAEATTYQDVAVEYKKNISKSLLNNGQNAKQIASKLGYDQVSNFYKSFKKWTGQTVQEYMALKIDADTVE